MGSGLHPEDAWVHILPADQIITRILKKWGARFAMYVRLSGAATAGIEAEDILHEFALYLYADDARRVRSFRGLRDARLASFLTTVFRRWFFRRVYRARRETQQITLSLRRLEDFSNDPAIIFQKNDLYLTLIRCMRHLDPADRKLLEERFFQGKSLAAIAREQGLKSHRVYQRFSIAMAALESALKKAGVGADVLREEHS